MVIEKNQEELFLSLVVPCFNEVNNVARFQQEAMSVLGLAGISFEIVYVDDGSNDGTLTALKELWAAKACPLQVIHFSRNFGKEAAMLAGMKAAKGSLVSLIDGDLQQPLETVVEMVEILRTEPEYDCVVAYQQKRKESKLRTLLKEGFYRTLNRFSEVKFVTNASDFRTMRRAVVEAVLSLAEYHRFSKGLLSWVGFQTKYIPYEVRNRSSGETKWSLYKLFRYAWEGILSFSTAPIKMAIFFGIGCAGLSFLYMIVILIQKLFLSISVPGYATIVCLILLLGGLQLFFLGIIGEYIGRIYIQTKNRPHYLIRQHWNWEQADDNGEKE